MDRQNSVKILIVDDEEVNLKLMGIILRSQGYDYAVASNGAEALAKAEELSPDLILLDVMMPGMDGFQVCGRLKEQASSRNIPVIMVTALNDRKSRLKGLEAGAADFLSKPLDATELLTRTRNLLRVKEFADFLKSHNELLEDEVRKRTEELRKTLDLISTQNVRLAEANKETKEGYLDTINKLTVVAEYKDEDTANHIKRVSLYCVYIARQLGWSEEEVEAVLYASPMHDIGKVGIPSEILLKRSSLNHEEFALMKTHTIIGGDILGESVSPLLRMAERIALSHHERWSGGGYPKGLQGEEIPMEGRIMNLADQYDALRSERCYKPPFDHDKAFKILTIGDGRTMPGHFDPRLLAIFKETHWKFEEIYEENKDA